MYRAAVIIGVLLLAVALVLVVADADGEADGMQTQIAPRRLARYPAAVGLALVILGGVGLLVPR